MRIKNPIRRTLAFVITAILLCNTVLAASSGDVISVALGEIGQEEGENEYSKYGEWYGLPNGYWCDMFVSWCAFMADVPKTDFPRHCACTEHVKRFQELGLYEDSAARGGSYIPRQGDVVFFYNNKLYPNGSVKNHTGLVLYVEDGWLYTIEGNALANRLDMAYADVAGLRIGDLEPPDYVTVNRYPLSASHIHGYGVPAYTDRTPLELNGFVDLARYAEMTERIETLCAEGAMAGTSSHTFSPDHGMTRGDYTALIMDFFGLAGYEAGTEPFSDVPEDSTCYDAVMTARCAGIIYGDETGLFRPEEYVSPEAAKLILERVQTYVGMEPEEFFFTRGDYSYILDRPYAIRVDIARALSDLRERLPLVESFDGPVTLNGQTVDWSLLAVSNSQGISCYASLEDLRGSFPELREILEGDFDRPPDFLAGGLPVVEEEESAVEALRVPAPLGAVERVVLSGVELYSGSGTAEMGGFVREGLRYVDLEAAAALLALDMEWVEDASALALTAPVGN